MEEEKGLDGGLKRRLNLARQGHKSMTDNPRNYTVFWKCFHSVKCFVFSWTISFVVLIPMHFIVKNIRTFGFGEQYFCGNEISKKYEPSFFHQPQICHRKFPSCHINCGQNESRSVSIDSRGGIVDGDV